MKSILARVARGNTRITRFKDIAPANVTMHLLVVQILHWAITYLFN